MALESAVRRLFAKLSSQGSKPDKEEKKKETEGPPIPHGWQSDMVPRASGKGARVEHSGGGGYSSAGSTRIQWVSRETDAEGEPIQERRPAPAEVKQLDVGFRAAGKIYPDLSKLAVHEEQSGPWALDMYGRTVLALRERFPCFDSSDLLYEHRYFRWFYLFQDGKLTCVYHTDESHTVTVTEDVLDIEDQCWREMQELDCFRERQDRDN